MLLCPPALPSLQLADQRLSWVAILLLRYTTMIPGCPTPARPKFRGPRMRPGFLPGLPRIAAASLAAALASFASVLIRLHDFPMLPLMG